MCWKKLRKTVPHSPVKDEIESERLVTKDDLIVPVYLNQRVVFDLVAMLQGGIASVTQVSRMHEQSGQVGAEVKTEFGLSNALASLLRVDLSGKVRGTKTGVSGETRSEQRIHTPASLFIELRASLREKRYILQDSVGMMPSPGEILEFSASLQRNPLLETIASLIELLGIGQAFENSVPKGAKGGQSREIQKLKGQMEAFMSSVAAGDTVDVTTAPLQCGYRSVITLEKQYLNDPSMSDLVDGTFRVVGKVTRLINTGEGAISLNRKSAMGRMPNPVLAELKESLGGADLEDFSFPDMEWEIVGPVIQVLPIAVFT